MKCPKHKADLKRDGNGILHCPKCRRNRLKRQENEILRMLCGTSARAARADMGL